MNRKRIIIESVVLSLIAVAGGVWWWRRANAGLLKYRATKDQWKIDQMEVLNSKDEKGWLTKQLQKQ